MVLCFGICFRWSVGFEPVAALFVLFIALQLLFKAKKNREVVNMSNNFFFECLVDLTSHLAAICGSAFVTVADIAP